MRSHAKAPTAGSTRYQATVALAVLTLLSLLFAAVSSAAVVTERPLLFRFDGSDTTAGVFDDLRGGVAIDEATDTVYVVDNARNVIDKFNADGEAQNFSATGTSSRDGSDTPQGSFNIGPNTRGAIAVDNSGVNPGRIYIATTVPAPGFPQVISAYSSAGVFLWQLSLGSISNGICGLAVDTAGHLWAAGGGKVREFAASGSPPAELSSFNASTGSFLCPLGIADDDDLYLVGGGGVTKYIGGAFDSIIDASADDGVAVDPSPGGHILTLRRENFNEYDATDTLLGNSGANTIYNSTWIAYNPGLDRAYVSEFSGRVGVFGAVTTGTAPDATTEAASELGVSKVKLNGKVNPQGVPNAYYFEWTAVLNNEGWSSAKSSALQSLPEDSSDHAVSLDATQLKGDTTYQARLVAINTGNKLRSTGAPITFKTAKAGSAPAVTIDEPSGVTTTTADIGGTANPQGDFGTTWRLQVSTDPACASGFSNRPAHGLESEAFSPVAITEELTDLLPSQHYCVRIAATNSFGTTTSATEEFTTAPVVPSGVFTAFAAPRTDTTARLNGRINPEGANPVRPLIYHFEYSKDGGSNWIPLPDSEYTGGAREQIVLAQELTGLSPNTTYSYRFRARNDAGEASPQGQTLTFTTRTSAEMNPPARGIELVNNPDKGNQNAEARWPETDVSPVSADGEKILWRVFGGAPGGVGGTDNTFLAKRTSNGWKSASVVPPAAQQVGGGDLRYNLTARTFDLTKLTFSVAISSALGGGEDPVMVRTDDSQHQEVLFEAPGYSMGPIEMTEDGQHVVNAFGGSSGTRQVEDIGNGTPDVLSLLPDGTPAPCLTSPGTQANPAYYRSATTDASRAYFTTKPGSCGGSDLAGLYVRNRESEETTLIDPGSFGKDVEFIRATPDGRSGYFATTSQLDPADANVHGDIYRWDEGSGESTCLTCEAHPDVNITSLPLSGGVFASVLVSDDFSHIYFESRDQLVPGQGRQDGANFYVLNDGEIRLVADLGPFSEALSNRLTFAYETQLSEDGNVLLFHAEPHPSLTADAVTSQCINPIGPKGAEGPCDQLYRYDDRDGGLECLSCRPGALTTRSVGAEQGQNDAIYKQSGDGSTTAFATREGLVPLDVNHDSDIYEWRNGALRLITDGVSDQPAGLSAMKVYALDRDGSDLFFGEVPPRGTLTGFEQDGLLNLYDARIGGGFEPPSPPTHCSEDSCQGPLEAAPAIGLSASSGFTGRGNVAPQVRKRRPCARKQGKAKRRCIRKHKRRASRRARAQHNTRGPK